MQMDLITMAERTMLVAPISSIERQKDYTAFLNAKLHYGEDSGFEPLWLPEFLYTFQHHLVEWAIRKGRAAIFADCGLGKTPIQLVWAENVVRQTNKPVLILTPLAVSGQTIRESKKFGIQAVKSSNGTHNGTQIVVTNYERLHYFDPADFAGIVCDESSILKNFDGKRRQQITEFMRVLPYRLLCTATAAPNDYFELGTSSEALGYLGFQDMITQFFRQETAKDYLGWGRTKYRIRDHAREPFWRWVCSWARALRRPSDYGFDDDGFALPPLKVNQTIVECSRPRDGMLFSIPAVDLQEQREERRITLKERCERAAEMAASHECSVAWCHLNPEGDLLERLIPDALQVSGKDSDDAKEEKLTAFTSGECGRLVTKAKIAGFGLNWQHCAHTTMFPSHSFEQYYQSVRRFLRFGQTQPVVVDVVTTEGESRVLNNLIRKAEQADVMFDQLIANMQRELRIERRNDYTQTVEVPGWLSRIK
jgi:hypothetical protein